MAGAIRIGSTWRHKKRGTSYEIVGLASMQISSILEMNNSIILSAICQDLERKSMVVYRALEDDTLWVRPESEFLDGRFEEVS